MKTLFTSILLILAMGSTSLAAAPAASSKISFKIISGKKVSLFVISPKGNGGQVDFVNSSGSRGVREISGVNYNFLKERIRGFNGPSNKTKQCARNYIEVKTSNKVMISCAGAKTRLAQNMQETTSLMSLLF